MACLGAVTALAQGYAPEEAASKMTLLPGFSAQLVACEPMIRQPVAMEFDDRGRLWVIQYLQYPNPEGLKRVEVDRFSRTKYDRVPEPPPLGPKGDDAITILEDTDGDGRMDSAKNFVEGLNLCSGMAFGYGGVFVINVPYLLFYPDKNRDDVPDGDPEVLLTGFGMEDAHSVANSLTWGPDGWLYGLQGSTVTANINGLEFQQGIWRYHPVTHAFELFCEGGGNMWGLDFDWEGNLIASTNYGPYIGLHGVQGGYYWKQFGKHGALHNPYTFGFFEHMTHHNPQGGHVAVGGTVYEADAYPAEYRGKYIAANLLSHDVYWNELRPVGSTFETHNLGQFLDSHDTWFAPSDLTLGPDGAIYVADWCDKRTAHPDPDATWDRSNGRIYRIVYKDMPRIEKFDLQAKSTSELVDLLAHPNKWYVRRALVLLAERKDASLHARLVEQIEESSDPRVALNSLFALHITEEPPEMYLASLLRHPHRAVRHWAIRFLSDRNIQWGTVTDLGRMVSHEKDPMVCSALASASARLLPFNGIAIGWTLAQRDDLATDPHIPLLLWWATEEHCIAKRAAILDMIANSKGLRGPIFDDIILPNLVRRYASEGSPAGDAACVRLLAHTDARQQHERFLIALDRGLRDRAHPVRRQSLTPAFAKAAPSTTAKEAWEIGPIADGLRDDLLRRWKADENNVLLLGMALRFKNAEAYTRVKKIASDPAAEPDKRVQMFELLGEFGETDCLDMVLATVADNSNPALQQAALEALRRIPVDGSGTQLLALYPTLDNAMKGRARDVLAAQPAWSKALVSAIDAGAISASDVPIEQVRAMANHDDAELKANIERIWGTIKPGTPEERLADVRRLNNELNAGPGDPAKGKKVFELNCAKCHELFGEGYKVGPDLTQANRMDRQYMLVTLVDPNETIRKEYQQFVVETKEDGMFNGIIAEQTPGTITLLNANAIRTTISMDDVVEVREAGVSLMPEGLITPLPGDDLRDLFAYLQMAAPEPPK